MNKRLTIYCGCSFILGLFIYIFQYFDIYLPTVINNYANDFLIIPIVLFICLFVLTKTRNNPNFSLSLPVILYVCAMYSVFFEFIIPEYLARYTKDYIDIILYFAGGIIFYQLQHQPQSTE